MNAIQTTNLTKKFKDFVAVDNLNLSIEQAELFVLLSGIPVVTQTYAA